MDFQFGTSLPSLKEVFNQLSFGRLLGKGDNCEQREAHLRVLALAEGVADALSEELTSFRPSERIKRPSDVMGSSIYDLAALHPEGLRCTVHLGGSSGAIDSAFQRRALDRAEASFRCEHFTAVGCREEIAEVKRLYQEGPGAGTLDAVRELVSWNIWPRANMVPEMESFMAPIEERARGPLKAAASVLIEEQSSFVSTPQAIWPSTRYSCFGDPDVAAVLAGRKPAALTNPLFIYQDPIGREFARQGKEAGLDTFWLGETSGGKIIQEVMIGKPEAVREYESLKRAYFGDEERPFDAHYHRTMGRILGYPESSIDEFSNHYP